MDIAAAAFPILGAQHGSGASASATEGGFAAALALAGASAGAKATADMTAVATPPAAAAPVPADLAAGPAPDHEDTPLPQAPAVEAIAPAPVPPSPVQTLGAPLPAPPAGAPPVTSTATAAASLAAASEPSAPSATPGQRRGTDTPGALEPADNPSTTPEATAPDLPGGGFVVTPPQAALAEAMAETDSGPPADTEAPVHGPLPIDGRAMAATPAQPARAGALEQPDRPAVMRDPDGAEPAPAGAVQAPAADEPAPSAPSTAGAMPTAGTDPRRQVTTVEPATQREQTGTEAHVTPPAEAPPSASTTATWEAPRAPPPGAPARQVLPAVVAVAIGGGGRITVTLEPGELGRVEISVERTRDAPQVVILAERPETLSLLQRDQRELDRALTQAGLQTEGRGLSFGLSGGDAGSGQPRHRRDAADSDRAARGMQGTDAAGLTAAAPARRVALSLLDLAI